MTNDAPEISIPDEIIITKIYLVRNKKVMLDRDLAELFNVKAIRLREQVKRNIEKFPDHFMFQLTDEEANTMVSQNAIPSRQHMGGALPYVFGEHGVLQLANVLKSGAAIKMSIKIIEIFVKMREILQSHNEILQKIYDLEQKDNEHDKNILRIFEYLKQLEKFRQEETKFKNRNPIGFKQV